MLNGMVSLVPLIYLLSLDYDNVYKYNMLDDRYVHRPILRSDRQWLMNNQHSKLKEVQLLESSAFEKDSALADDIAVVEVVVVAVVVTLQVESSIVAMIVLVLIVAVVAAGVELVVRLVLAELAVQPELVVLASLHVQP